MDGKKKMGNRTTQGKWEIGRHEENEKSEDAKKMGNREAWRKWEIGLREENEKSENAKKMGNGGERPMDMEETNAIKEEWGGNEED